MLKYPMRQLNLPKDLELPMRKSDFDHVSNELQGSRDVGAQLFCALLRSVGVDARLVCSFQPLPFTATTKGTTPQKPSSMIILADPESRTASSNDDTEVETKKEQSSAVPRPIGSVGGRSRFGSKPTSKLAQPIQSNVNDRPNFKTLTSGNSMFRLT